MTDQIARLLREKPALPAEFLTGATQTIDVEALTVDYPRKLDVDPLTKIVEHAMSTFSEHRVESDAWLAPRVHAALRLSRAEAGDKRLWWYLAVAVVPTYVRWRWPGDEEVGTPTNRFFGGESKQALARLWWSAEFFRRGGDYTPVVAAMKLTDVPNSLLFDFYHNRPMAIAAIRVLEGLNGGMPASSDEQTDIPQAVNMMATTTVVDALAPDAGPSAAAISKWCEEYSPDWTLMTTALPAGPEEDGPSDDLINAAETFLRHVATSLGLPKAAAPAPSPPEEAAA